MTSVSQEHQGGRGGLAEQRAARRPEGLCPGSAGPRCPHASSCLSPGLQLGEATGDQVQALGQRAALVTCHVEAIGLNRQEASPSSKPLRSHASQGAPRCLGSRQWDLTVLAARVTFNCKYTVHACRICDAKTQTVKTELNKLFPVLPSAMGALQSAGSHPWRSRRSHPPAGHLPPRGHQAPSNLSTKWPCLHSMQLPGKPSTVRARLHVRLTQPQPSVQVELPGADSLCCVTTPRDKREQSDSSVCAERAFSRTTGGTEGPGLSSSEPKPTHRPQQHPKRSLSEPFPPPGNLSSRL